MPIKYEFEIKLNLTSNLMLHKNACKELEMLLLDELASDKVNVDVDVKLLNEDIQKMPEKKIV